jgi:hypothetical protein
MQASYRGLVLPRDKAQAGPHLQAVTEGWASRLIHEQATTATTGLGHRKLAMLEQTGTEGPPRQVITAATINMDLPGVGPPMVEIRMQVSRRRVGRRATALVASKYPA